MKGLVSVEKTLLRKSFVAFVAGITLALAMHTFYMRLKAGDPSAANAALLLHFLLLAHVESRLVGPHVISKHLNFHKFLSAELARARLAIFKVQMTQLVTA